MVHSTRVADVPQVTEVIAVEDQQTGEGATAFTVTELFTRPSPEAPLTWTGNLPVRCGRALASAGIDVRELLDPAAASGSALGQVGWR